MIVFLNGASSSGKTSLARELQECWVGPLLYWSLDTVISQLPLRYTGGGQNSEEGFPLRPVQGGHEVGIGSIGLQLNALSAWYLRGVAEGGIDIVADFVLLNDNVLSPYLEELDGQELAFVGIDCDLAELNRRNEARDDRAPGLAVLQQETVHFCRSRYDLELNSSESDTQEMACRILSHSSVTRPNKGFR